MGGITFEAKGSYSKTEAWVGKMSMNAIRAKLDTYAQLGVRALASATPRDTGTTAASWGYEIKTDGNSWTITWTNSNIVKGTPIAIILQYGHGTGTGGYVQGRDYINPAIQPIMDTISDGVWEVVKRG